MENYIEKVLCIELLEKISRLKKYLLSHNESTRHEGKEVVGLFLTALSRIQDKLDAVMSFVKSTSSLNNPEKGLVLKQISEIFQTIVVLHDQLQLVYGSWVRPETHTFINEILNFFPSDRKPKKVNIVLTNEYNFLEGNLTWLFEDILRKNLKVQSRIREENPTVFLPKLDYNNPLNWAILAHECGHVDIKGVENLLNKVEIIPKDLKEPYKTYLRNWAEEIYCDLIASKILGPAYLASFCSYALLVAGVEGNEEHCETHPANIIRISIIQGYLDSLNIKVPLDDNALHSPDIGSYYFDMLEEYNELSRKFLNSYSTKLPNPKKIPFNLTAFVDVISEQVDDIVKLNLSLNDKDFVRIKRLKDRLSQGVTIGSYQELEELEKARKNYPNDDVSVEELNIAKDALQETRTKLWEIVNAGWKNKIENLLPSAIDLFFNNENNIDLNQKIDVFGNYLEQSDNVILKSIESSEIFKIMEETENGII